MDKAAASVKKSVSGLYDFLSSFCYIWWAGDEEYGGG